MKRMLSGIVCTSLLIGSIYFPVEAKNMEDIALYVSCNKQGEFVLYDVESSNMGTAIPLWETEYEGVYETEYEELVLQTGDTTFQSVIAEEIVMDSYVSVQEQLKNISVTSEEKDDILRLTKEQNEIGNYDAKTVIFRSQSSEGRAKSSNTYTYNGHKMKDETTYYLNLETDSKTISSGSKAKGVAEALKSVAISVAGSASSTVSLFSSGISALQAYCDAVNVSASKISTVDPSNYSRVKAHMNYNIYTKMTYEDRGSGYELGAITQRYIINKIVLTEYFIVNDTYGAKKTFTKALGANSSGDKKSKYFTNPASCAVTHIGNCYDDTISSVNVKFGTVTLKLSNK